MTILNILAIDTSGQAAGVAIARDQTLLYETVAINQLTHSVNIMPMVEQACILSSIAINEIDLIACVTGPGSFTGVRIGTSAAKAMAHAHHIKCIGVSSLETLSDIPFAGVVCPLLDARAGQVYAAAFKNGNRLMADTAMKLDTYIETIRTLGECFLFVGDGVDAYRAVIFAAMADKAYFLPSHLNHIRASAAAHIAYQHASEAGDYLSLMPMYLRAPQAERERMAREALANGK